MAKKRKRAKKKGKPPATTEEQTVATTDTVTATQGSPTLLGESMLSRLRSRLDPLYNTSPLPPPSESSPLPPMRLEHLTRGPPLPTEDRGSEQARTVQEDTSVREGDHTEGSTSQKGSHRRTRWRKNDTQEAFESPGKPSDTQDGAAASEDVRSQQQEELKSTSREALVAGATGGNERKKRRRRERERSRRTSGCSIGENTPDTGEEITAEVTGGSLDSNVDDGVPPPANRGITLDMIICVHMLT